MIKNIPSLLNLAYYGYNRGLTGDFKPSNGETYCNFFIQYVCNGFGYDKFNGLMANEIIDFMKKPENGWLTVSDEVAQQHANNGVIVIAGAKAEGHGHVCLIIPGILEKSGGYEKSVPKCVNIGKDVFIGKKVSYAFAADNKPEYFALAQMI